MSDWFRILWLPVAAGSAISYLQWGLAPRHRWIGYPVVILTGTIIGLLRIPSRTQSPHLHGFEYAPANHIVPLVVAFFAGALFASILADRKSPLVVTIPLTALLVLVVQVATGFLMLIACCG